MQKTEKRINPSVAFLKKLLTEENLLISFCSVAFYLTGAKLLYHPYNPWLGSFVFWSTLLIYQVNTKLGFNIADAGSYKNLESIQKQRLVFYLIICLIISAHLVFIDLSVIIFILHLGIISTLYNVPRKQQRSFLPLRSVPVLKVFLIAYVWASISAMLPWIDSGVSPSGVLPVFIAHFLFILAITLPFDIRDFRTDYRKQLTTVPNVVGIRTTKISALMALIISVGIIYFLMHSPWIMLLAVVVGYLIINASPGKKDHYYTLYIDGTILLYFLIVLLSLR